MLLFIWKLFGLGLSPFILYLGRQFSIISEQVDGNSCKSSWGKSEVGDCTLPVSKCGWIRGISLSGHLKTIIGVIDIKISDSLGGSSNIWAWESITWRDCLNLEDSAVNLSPICCCTRVLSSSSGTVVFKVETWQSSWSDSSNICAWYSSTCSDWSTFFILTSACSGDSSSSTIKSINWAFVARDGGWSSTTRVVDFDTLSDTIWCWGTNTVFPDDFGHHGKTISVSFVLLELSIRIWVNNLELEVDPSIKIGVKQIVSISSNVGGWGQSSCWWSVNHLICSCSGWRWSPGNSGKRHHLFDPFLI